MMEDDEKKKKKHHKHNHHNDMSKKKEFKYTQIYIFTYIRKSNKTTFYVLTNCTVFLGVGVDGSGGGEITPVTFNPPPSDPPGCASCSVVDF